MTGELKIQTVTDKDLKRIVETVNNEMKRSGNGSKVQVEQCFQVYVINIIRPDGTAQSIYSNRGIDRAYCILYGMLNGLHVASRPANTLLD